VARFLWPFLRKWRYIAPQAPFFFLVQVLSKHGALVRCRAFWICFRARGAIFASREDHGEKKNSSGGRPSSLVPCRGDKRVPLLGDGVREREMHLWAGVPVDGDLGEGKAVPQ
jgi:hypothetical protein